MTATLSYAEHFRRHLRLALLRVLAGAPAYRANAQILHASAESLGLAASRDQVRGELAWLEDAGHVNCSDVGGLTVAALTERGLDVAEGRARAPGVARPTPLGAGPG